MVNKLKKYGKLRPFMFKNEQKTFKIGNVIFGGLPGERPVVLVGSIFFLGEKMVVNHKEGIFDKEKAKEKIEFAKKVAEEYNLQFAIDLVAYTSKAAEKYLEFISEVTEAPIFLDGIEESVRVRMYQVSHELGLTSRVIGNAIYVHSSDEELESLKENKIEAAVLMAFDMANPVRSLTPEDKLKILSRELLPKVRKIGLAKPLVDVVVLDPASIAVSGPAVFKIKSETGLPTGCAPANALGNISKKSFGVEEAIGIHAGSATYLQLFAVDFIFYGPLRRIKDVAPAVSMVDSYLGYLARLEGRKIPKKHPFYSILKKVQKAFTGISIWQPLA